jgi:N-acetylmuramoyl-L-alanine amidase/uncharacterized protein YjdB
MFTRAAWGEDTLTLTLAKEDGFLGYKGYYDSNGNLVFRFNTPPESLRGARIAVDAGHGGSDFGASGFLTSHPENVINRQIAERVVSVLESRGAQVLLIENAGNPGLASRVSQAEAFNADLFISIHCNTGQRLSAIGTETFYFYPYARHTASALASGISRALQTENRGAKRSYYHITLSAQVPSVLIESGFLSNREEYEKLIDPSYQQAIATGIADGLEAGIRSASTGVFASGSQSIGGVQPTTPGGSAAGTTTGASSSPGTTGGSASIEDLTFSEDYYKIGLNSSYTLQFFAYPEDANLDVLTFRSENTSVATVTNSGVVTGHREGIAKITMTAPNGLTASCTVEVVRGGGLEDARVPVNGISLDREELFLARNTTAQLRVTFSPENATNKRLTYRSSNQNTATVDSSGLVRARNPGTATITVTSDDGRRTATCTVTVTQNHVPVEEIETFFGVDMVVGEAFNLEVEIYPRNATERGVTWSSNRPDIVSVDSEGFIRALKEGVATITVTSAENPRISHECVVSVYAR